MTTTTVTAAPTIAPALTIRDAWIVSWGMRNVSVKYDAIQRALAVAGLPGEAATEMLKSNAFRRALKEMCEGKLAREVRETKEHILFQITRPEKALHGSGVEDVSEEYVPEAILALDKNDGSITCHPVKGFPPPADPRKLSQFASDLLAEHLGKRNTADLSRMIMRLCDGTAVKKAKKKAARALKESTRKRRVKKGDPAPVAAPISVPAGPVYAGSCDLFPIKGGVYVAFPTDVDFLDRVDVFLGKLGDYQLDRMPLSGDAAGTATMARTVSDGLEDAVREYEEKVALFCDREKKGVAATTELYEGLATARLRLDGYREFLKDKYAKLVERVSGLSDQLTASLEADAAPGEDPVACPEGEEATSAA